MAAPASSVTINILGRDYQISCPPEEEEALRKSARYLASQMEEVKGKGSSLAYEKVAVLAALNITHDLLKRSKDANLSESDASREIKLLEKKIDAVLLAARQIEL